MAFMTSFCVLMSCTKTTTPTPAPPEVKQLTKTEILTQKPWQVEELIHDISSTNTQYIRGGINTTGINYDLMRFVFKADGTGSHTDQTGSTYSLTWHFVSTAQQDLEMTVNLPTTTTYQWNLLQIADSTVNATVKIKDNKYGDILESFRLVQVK
jgi:hypothetical protein